MSNEDAVREASKRFYAALNGMAQGNSGSMADCWSHGAVTAMHPMPGRDLGWEEVKASFDRFAGMASDGKIGLKDQVIRVVGDVAYEIGIENGVVKLAGKPVNLEHRVTNIYQRDSGTWKMIHHHAETSPAMLEVIKQLQPR